MFLAVGTKRFFLDDKVFLLRGGGHANIRKHFPVLGGDQPTILQILLMGVVAPIRGATEGRQNPLAVPFLQGIDGLSNQFPKLFRRICMLHAYILPCHHLFFNTVKNSFPMDDLFRVGRGFSRLAGHCGASSVPFSSRLLHSH